jgi:hypothetical protein
MLYGPDRYVSSGCAQTRVDFFEKVMYLTITEGNQQDLLTLPIQAEQVCARSNRLFFSHSPSISCYRAYDQKTYI